LRLGSNPLPGATYGSEGEGWGGARRDHRPTPHDQRRSLPLSKSREQLGAWTGQEEEKKIRSGPLPSLPWRAPPPIPLPLTPFGRSGVGAIARIEEDPLSPTPSPLRSEGASGVGRRFGFSETQFGIAEIRALIAVLGLALASAAAAAGQIPDAKPDSFSAVATPTEVKFGAELRYVITVHHPKGDTYSLPAEVDLTPFQLVSVSKARSDKGDQGTSDFTFKLQMLDLGEKRIPDVTLLVEGKEGSRKLVVPGPSVKGISDLPENADLRDIHGPVSVWVRSFRSLLIAAAIILLAMLGWFLYRRLGQRVQPVAAPVVDPAHVRALRELAGIRAEDLPGKGRKKEMYFRISEIVRRYLGERYAFNAVDLTTPELLASLRKVDASGLDYGEFQRFCEESDLVKFAKFDPNDAECVGALGIAVSFVERTAPRPPANSQARAA
jgi:hypothetical protein